MQSKRLKEIEAAPETATPSDVKVLVNLYIKTEEVLRLRNQQLRLNKDRLQKAYARALQAHARTTSYAKWVGLHAAVTLTCFLGWMWELL